MNLKFDKQLPSSLTVKEEFAPSETAQDAVKDGRQALSWILSGEDDRIILVIGPCSADSESSVVEYVSRLAEVQTEVKDSILIVPRVYTNKPRTNGKGYKGLLHQPDPQQKPDAFKGIIATRKLHLKVIEETGLICADELLYPDNYEYLDDLIGYVAIGARSVENQEHRLLASGIEVPVGMKNPTSGDLTVMMNSIIAGQSPHDFIFRGWSCQSTGNPFTHSILRGYTDEQGGVFPNYDYETVEYLYDLYRCRPELSNPSVVIDCNHSNSNKKPFEQPRIAKEVLKYRKYNKELDGFIKGFMIESYLEDGCQPADGGIFGKSITDACLGWEKSKKLIHEIAELV